MDSQLEAVRQNTGSVKDEIVKTKQDLAAAEQAGNKGKERVLLDLLLSLNNQLLSLQEKENILLRNQAPSKPCLQLVHTGLPVFTSFRAPFNRKEGQVCVKYQMRIYTGCTAKLWGQEPLKMPHDLQCQYLVRGAGSDAEADVAKLRKLMQETACVCISAQNQHK